MQKNENNLIHREKCYAFENAPRCNAKTKNNNGKPCLNPAIKGKLRCRVHGGASPGAPLCNDNALTHGNTTAKAKAFRKEIKRSIQLSQEILKQLTHAEH
jgi:glucans biosynthesis protein